MPDEATILNSRRLLETNDLASKLIAVANTHLSARGLLLGRGIIVDATISNAASSTKNADKGRVLEVHQMKKRILCYFGRKARTGLDVEWGLLHTVTTTAASVADIVEVAQLQVVRVEAMSAGACAGYLGSGKCAPKHGRARITARKQCAVKAMPESELRDAT